MNRVFGLILISLSATLSVATAELHPCGYIEEDLHATAPGHQVFSIPIAPGAPVCSDVSYVDLSDELPPVGNQGGIGSCTSWSVAYYHRTQLEYRERGWDLTDPNHHFSPSFCYNQVNGGVDGGSGFSNNMGLIMQQGCAPMADCPYGTSYISWPSESAYSRALPFRVKSWHWFETADRAGIDRIKQLLVNGSTASLAISVYPNFDNIGRFNYTYCASERYGDRRGGHMVTLIGYDDTLTTADGTGAFRLVNSWGPNWGDRGFFWMSYEGVMDEYISGQAVGYMVDTTGYEPTLLARVKIDHPTRDRVGIDFMVGSRTNPLWYRSWRTWRRPQADHPFPDNKMVFDLTEAADYIDNETTDSIYFVCTDGRRDGRDGTVSHMSAQYLPWGNVFESDHTPVDIPDNGNTVYAGARVDQYDNDVAAHPVVEPHGIVTPDSQYTPVARVWNFGRNPVSFPVIFRIGSVYLDTVVVSGLQPSDSAHVLFRTWNAPSRGGFGVWCSTALVGDEYSGNDVVTDSVHLRLHDIAIQEIVCPVDTVDSGAVVRPQVRVRNNGTQTETFDAFFRIPDEAYMGRASRSLEPDTEVVMAFAVWVPKLRGTHALSCTVALNGDMEQGNNIMTGSVYVGPGTGVAERPEEPLAFGLDRAGPSHFSGNTVLNYSLPGPAEVSLDIVDVTGAMVRSLVKTRVSAGKHLALWDGRDRAGRNVPAGLYFCRLVAGKHTATSSLMKIR